jgi:hypothetical protein
MHYRDLFLIFAGVSLIGFALLRIFPEWAIYIGLASFIVVGVRLFIQGIKSKVAATPFRPTIEDLENERLMKEEAEARKKFVADELRKYKNTDDGGQSDIQ